VKSLQTYRVIFIGARMRIVMLLFVCLNTLAACSTRQVTDSVSGSTAQRLVTYSIERFIPRLLAARELDVINNKTVYLQTHFLNDYALLDYATEVLAYKLNSQRGVVLVGEGESHDYNLDVFFNSIGTDNDNYGLSLPSFGIFGSVDARVSLLAIDRYHGVTEGYAVVSQVQGNVIAQTSKSSARVRADNVTTPIISFPINQLE